ncbi:MAG: 16S rRNA (guanine(527)-N(7))-methyltransferase RsmG [Bdellovibrionota bacterium]
MLRKLETALGEAAGRAGAKWIDLAPRVEILCRELLRWNESMRLTALGAEEILEHLVLEALRILAHCPPSGTALDVGSGAGFPALILALARPALLVTSVEAREKKAHFQRHAARELGLSNLEVIAGRLEPQGPAPFGEKKFGVATAQALAPPAELVPLLSPHLAPGGRLVLPRGPAWKEERPAALEAARKAGLSILSEEASELPLSGARRILVVLGGAG